MVPLIDNFLNLGYLFRINPHNNDTNLIVKLKLIYYSILQIL